MLQYIQIGFGLYLRLLFLLTPFFVLGIFISLTKDLDQKLRTRLALRITLAAIAVTLTIFFAGGLIMKVFGITVDAFRAGSGVLLLLSAVSLVFGENKEMNTKTPDKLMDMAVVPLSVPVTAGPATLGALMVMGTSAESMDIHFLTALAIVMACASIGAMLYVSNWILKVLGKSNITILSKLTGLVLSAIALQMIIVGAKNLWLLP